MSGANDGRGSCQDKRAANGNALEKQEVVNLDGRTIGRTTSAAGNAVAKLLCRADSWTQMRLLAQCVYMLLDRLHGDVVWHDRK
jgi:hypothetical protein